jgi:hypothetical protein
MNSLLTAERKDSLLRPERCHDLGAGSKNPAGIFGNFVRASWREWPTVSCAGPSVARNRRTHSRSAIVRFRTLSKSFHGRY